VVKLYTLNVMSHLLLGRLFFLLLIITASWSDPHVYSCCSARHRAAHRNGDMLSNGKSTVIIDIQQIECQKNALRRGAPPSTPPTPHRNDKLKVGGRLRQSHSTGGTWLLLFSERYNLTNKASNKATSLDRQRQSNGLLEQLKVQSPKR
jgi:hypothetical protein